MKYSVQELGGLYGIFRNGSPIIIVEKEKNAELIKNILMVDDDGMEYKNLSNPAKLVLKFDECMEVLQVGRNTLGELCHREDFPSFKMGRIWLINYEKLKEWVGEQCK